MKEYPPNKIFLLKIPGPKGRLKYLHLWGGNCGQSPLSLLWNGLHTHDCKGVQGHLPTLVKASQVLGVCF